MSQNRGDIRLRAVRNADKPLARSPRPYRRKSVSLQHGDVQSSGTETPVRDGVRFSDSSEDYVLEADDEKGPLLRLPAPAVRTRKGLKGVHDPSLELTPAVSPLLTPVDELSQPILERNGSQQQQLQAQKLRDEQYSKYCRRRRQEVVRRVTETVLLLVIAGLNILKLSDDFPSVTLAIPEVQDGLLAHVNVSKYFMLLVVLCYSTYPIRKSLSLLHYGLSAALKAGFHIPSRFDPGPLLYPVLLPFVISASVTSSAWFDDRPAVLANVVLGVGSIPCVALPMGANHVWWWVLTLIPVWFAKINSHPDVSSTLLGELPFLFPLHQNLVAAITSLVTTSLDPAEIQLLSSGLSNLLLFARTPQSQILKALLWVGGVCLFLFGEFAFKAEVAIARIPAWRFARNRPSKKGLRGRINRLLRAVLPEYPSRFAAVISSDDEDETIHLPQARRLIGKARTRIVRKDQADLQKVWSADEHPKSRLETRDVLPQSRSSRAATFSTFGRAAQFAIRWRNIVSSSNPYLRLSFLHAQALRIFLAIYTYILLVVTILGPVKYFIDTRALNGHEAIGWAIGYFLGDVQQLRLFLLINGLERWIPLPAHKTSYSLGSDPGRMEKLRIGVLGGANTRLALAGYCVIVVLLGIITVLKLQMRVEVDTRRKVFHGVMVVMLLPAIPVDPCFFGLALTIVLAVFLMLDLFRASQIPPISKPLTMFLAPYVDGRDHRGPVIVSHIFLLVGCAVPLWLSLACTDRRGDGPLHGWEVALRDLGMVSGVICVGMGDAAASLVGRRYGRTKWFWGGGKSLEGSIAFALAVTVGLTASWCWLRVGGWDQAGDHQFVSVIIKSAMAGIGSSMLESTLTAANDNVVVPIGLWLLVRGLKI